MAGVGSQTPQGVAGGGAGAAGTMAAAPRPAETGPSVPRRKKPRKAPEKQSFPDRVSTVLPESALYSQLLEFEARVDSALARKKADIQAALKNPPRQQKTLRVYIFNTFANQPQGQGQGQGRNSNTNPNANSNGVDPPSWTLRIGGRLLEDKAEGFSGSLPKFSSFFRRISIRLDQALYPTDHTIVWDGVRAASQVEGFEIKRKGEKEFTAAIQLEMTYSPEKYKLSPSLTDVLRIEVDTRPRIIAALWQYVKAKKLQSSADPSIIICDPPLQRVFGEERLKFSAISQKLSHHLSPPQPIYLEHRVRLSGSSPVGNACYDIVVDVPLPLQKEMGTFLGNAEKHKEIEMYDEAICNAIRKIQEHRRRRAFFLGFSQSPVDFINVLIASQSKDLKAVAEAGRNTERERRSDFYSQPWVEDAVLRYLNRRPAAGAEATGTS